MFGLGRSYQVRGHLAAQIDPLGLNNMEQEEARKMIIRSVQIDNKVNSQRLPSKFILYFIIYLCPHDPHNINVVTRSLRMSSTTR